jgi:succinate dehydrogenase / fumarate reductase membrane anchor subunit
MRDGFDVTPRLGEGAGLWFLKILTGFLVIVVLIIHLIVNHLIVEGGLLTYADVVHYYQNPIIPIMEIAFLIIVVTHALIGLRSVLLDLQPSNKVLRLINYGLVVLGVGSIAYGIWLVLVIVNRG